MLKLKLIFPNFYEYVILENVLKNFIIFYWYLIISGSGLMTHFINIYADRICLATIIKKKKALCLIPYLIKIKCIWGSHLNVTVYGQQCTQIQSWL